MSVAPDLHVADRQPSNVVDHPKGFAKVMNDVARSRRLTAAELGVYTLIVGYAGPDGECFTDQETLAGFLDMTVRSLQRHLRELVRKGFLDGRARHESYEGKGRAYSLSNGWRRLAPDSHDTGVARLSGQIESHTTPAPKSHDKIGKSHTTPVSHLKRPVKRPGEKTAVPEPAGGGGRPDAATAAATAAAVESGPDDDQTTATTSPQATPSSPPGHPSPRPKSSAAPKVVARSVHRKPRTEPPEVIPIPPPLLDWATGQGYTPEIIAGEMERCLDWHRVEGKPSADWGASLRTWLKNEVTYSREDGRALGDHVRKTPGSSRHNGSGAGAPQRNGPSGSRTGPRDPVFREQALEAGKKIGW